jgi:hypothetical protein
MESTPALHWKRFLLVLALLALTATVIDLLRHAWLPATSSACLLIGALAFQRSLHYHSARWRTIALVALVLAVALQFARAMMA